MPSMGSGSLRLDLAGMTGVPPSFVNDSRMWLESYLLSAMKTVGGGREPSRSRSKPL
jgi:phage portal protein BeeE